MTHARLFFVALLLWLCAGSGWAQEKTLLLIPLEMKGTYLPLTETELAAILKKEIEQVAPDLKVTVDDSDPTILGPKDAARVGQAAGTTAVFYGNVRFRKEAKAMSLTGAPPEGYPGGGIATSSQMRYLVTVAGVAHGYLVDSASGTVLADQPELFFESEATGGALDGELMQELERTLADKCIRELSERLVEHMKAQTDKK